MKHLEIEITSCLIGWGTREVRLSGEPWLFNDILAQAGAEDSEAFHEIIRNPAMMRNGKFYQIIPEYVKDQLADYFEEITKKYMETAGKTNDPEEFRKAVNKVFNMVFLKYCAFFPADFPDELFDNFYDEESTDTLYQAASNLYESLQKRAKKNK